MASKLHQCVDSVITLFQRNKGGRIAESAAYEAVEVEDEDGDLDEHRGDSHNVPMTEIRR